MHYQIIAIKNGCLQHSEETLWKCNLLSLRRGIESAYPDCEIRVFRMEPIDITAEVKP